MEQMLPPAAQVEVHLVGATARGSRHILLGVAALHTHPVQAAFEPHRMPPVELPQLLVVEVVPLSPSRLVDSEEGVVVLGFGFGSWKSYSSSKGEGRRTLQEM